MMLKKFLTQVKQNFISGTLLIIPLLVLFVLLEKVWFFFHKYGEKVAVMIGLEKLFGPIATDIMGGIILLILLYLSGYFVRLTFMQSLSNWIDETLKVYIPGYEKHKKTAEKKLLKTQPVAPPVYLPILLKSGEYWQPAYLIEENNEDEVAVFVPNAPLNDQGQIFVVPKKAIKKLDVTTTSELEISVKSKGKGILNFK